MGREIEDLKKYGKVYKLSFVQAKYDAELYCNEKDADTIAIELSKKDKILSIIKHLNMPFYFSSRCSKQYRKEIGKILESDENIKYVHAEYAAMGQYFRYIKDIRKDIKLTYVLHDVTIQSYDRQLKNAKGFIKKLFIKYQRTMVKKCESKWLDEADNILVFCDKDKKLLEDIYKIEPKKIKVINTYFELESKEERLNKYVRIKDDEIHYFFYGQLLREENREAAVRAIEIYDKYKKETTKKTKLYLIGNSKNSDLLNYQTDEIICTGFVDDVDKFIIENCDIALFPLKTGAGIKVKVLHCLALGLPVITGIVGAEGIDNTGEYIYLAEEDTEYTQYMRKLEDKSFRCERKDKNIEYINREFSWSKTMVVFDGIYL